MRRRCVTAGLALSFWAAGASAQVSDWVDAGAARHAPRANIYDSPCRSGAGPCNDQAWLGFLIERGEADLQAPAGGRAYRYFIDRYDFGLGLQIVRLEVRADGTASLTSSYPGRPPRRREISADKVAEFDAVLADSGFASMTRHQGECENGDPAFFEAVVDGRYKTFTDTCGGGPLAPVMDFLNRLT